MNVKLKILHLEDVLTDAELVGIEIKKSYLSFEKLDVDNRIDYINALNEYVPDIILSDHSLPSFNSLEALKILKESFLNIPFILITSTISEEFAVEIMKEGATDYILKDRMQRLPNAIVNALEKFKLEAEHQRASQELSLLFNTIDEVFFSRDVINSKLIQVSPACEKVFGYTGSEMFNTPNLEHEILYPADQHIHEENYKKLLLGQTALSRYRIIHKEGSIRWVESKIMPRLSETGVLIRLSGVTRDITEQKLAEESLVRSEGNLRSVFENTDLSIILFTNDLKVAAFNSNANGFV
ncbi:MAG: hypothetical protein JWQ06_1819, partial [Mucilaginibacter sp.]|nr:hypothetical protein [Mucilaginibacter sp.]